jgi:hypothetical protein
MQQSSADHFWEFVLNDKTVLTFLILVVLGIWAYKGEPKLFDLINLFAGALIALITGAVLKRNGNTIKTEAQSETITTSTTVGGAPGAGSTDRV